MWPLFDMLGPFQFRSSVSNNNDRCVGTAINLRVDVFLGVRAEGPGSNPARV
jgi:hypothetical protein